MKNITKNITMPVFDYVPGTKISKTGVYRDVPMDVYHGDACTEPSLSSSGVRLIESKSLLHFYDQSYLNPNRAPQEEKHHFSLGRAVHHLAGGEKNFSQHFAVRPDKWDSWRTNDARAWRAEQVLARKGILEPKDLDLIRGIADELAAHPVIQAGILSGLVEHSVFWKRRIRIYDGRVVTIWLKSRPDVLPLDSDMIVDLKTTADASPVAVRRSMGDFGYHIQLGMAHEGLKAAWGRTMRDHVLAFIEAKRPYAINLKPIEPLSIEYGRRQLRRGVEKFAAAVADNAWPGYDDDQVPANVPTWLLTQLSKQAEDGTLPAIDDEPDPDEDDAEAI